MHWVLQNPATGALGVGWRGGGTEAKPPQSHSVNTDAGPHPGVDFGIQILPTPCPDTGWIRKRWLKIVTLEILKLS